MSDANGKPKRRKKSRPPKAVREAERKASKTHQNGDSPPAPIPEGEGGILDGPRGRQDLRDIKRAVRQGWTIPSDLYIVLPVQLAEIALDARRPARERLLAASTLVTMNGQNQRDEHATTPNVNLNVDMVEDPVRIEE